MSAVTADPGVAVAYAAEHNLNLNNLVALIEHYVESACSTALYTEQEAGHLARPEETETHMGKMKGLHAIRYQHTHQSVHDASPAMSLGLVAGGLMLMNEEGDTWVSAPDAWVPIR